MYVCWYGNKYPEMILCIKWIWSVLFGLSLSHTGFIQLVTCWIFNQNCIFLFTTELFQRTSVYCFKAILFSVAGQLYLRFQGCYIYRFGVVLLNVSGLCYLMFQGCVIYCFRVVLFTVSGVLRCGHWLDEEAYLVHSRYRSRYYYFWGKSCHPVLWRLVLNQPPSLPSFFTDGLRYPLARGWGWGRVGVPNPPSWVRTCPGRGWGRRWGIFPHPSDAGGKTETLTSTVQWPNFSQSHQNLTMNGFDKKSKVFVFVRKLFSFLLQCVFFVTFQIVCIYLSCILMRAIRKM